MGGRRSGGRSRGRGRGHNAEPPPARKLSDEERRIAQQRMAQLAVADADERAQSVFDAQQQRPQQQQRRQQHPQGEPSYQQQYAQFQQQMQQEQQSQRHRQQPQQRNLQALQRPERPPADEHNFSGRVTFAALVAQYLTVGGDKNVPEALNSKWAPPQEGDVIVGRRRLNRGGGGSHPFNATATTTLDRRLGSGKGGADDDEERRKSMPPVRRASSEPAASSTPRTPKTKAAAGDEFEETVTYAGQHMKFVIAKDTFVLAHLYAHISVDGRPPGTLFEGDRLKGRRGLNANGSSKFKAVRVTEVVPRGDNPDSNGGGAGGQSEQGQWLDASHDLLAQISTEIHAMASPHSTSSAALLSPGSTLLSPGSAAAAAPELTPRSLALLSPRSPRRRGRPPPRRRRRRRRFRRPRDGGADDAGGRNAGGGGDAGADARARPAADRFEPEAVAAAPSAPTRRRRQPGMSVGGRRLLAEVDRLIAKMERRRRRGRRRRPQR